MALKELTTFQRIRQGLHQRFEADLLKRVQDSLATTALGGGEATHDRSEVWLFGSRAPGDWDGWSDIDLLVVADTQQQADRFADALLDARLRADVIALSRARWDGMARSDSPHWQASASRPDNCCQRHEREAPSLAAPGEQ
jgi:hypothetical protein